MYKPYLYFAYGSNLNMDHFSERCPLAEPVDTFVLPGWRMVFRSVADIIPSRGDHVFGALYRITDRCERALDRYEGYPRLYSKREYSLGRYGETLMFYTMNRTWLDLPHDDYLQTIWDGYEHWGLPTRNLTNILERQAEHSEGEMENA